MSNINKKIKALRAYSGKKFSYERNLLMNSLVTSKSSDDLITRILDISMIKLNYSRGKEYITNRNSLFFFCNNIYNYSLGNSYIRKLLDLGISRTLTEMKYEVDRNVNLEDLKGKRYCFKSNTVV